MLTPTPAQVKAAFSAGDFKRGLVYFNKGHVLRLEFRGDGIVEGIVKGSQRSPYHVEVAITQSGSRIKIGSFCSCPVGFNCKHGVAVALTIAYSAGGGTQSSNGWFSRLESAAAVETGYPPEVKERVLYLLDLAAARGNPPVVQLQMVVARRLKAGGYGRTRAYNIWSRGQYVLLEDDAIAHQLVAAHWTPYTSRLEGRWGSRLLRQILETERAHWRNADTPPLRLAPARRGELKWQSSGDTAFLRLAVEGDPLLLPVAPPWYLDPKSGECGPLETGFSDLIAEQWAVAPPFTPQELPRLETALRKAGAKVAIDPPPTLRRVEVTESAVPCLELSAVHHRFLGAPVDAARLSFAYGGERLDVEPGAKQTHWLRDDVVVVVHRDAAAEEKAVKRLEKAGLYLLDQSAADGPGVFIVHPEEPERSWLRFVEEVLPVLREEGWRITEDESFGYRLVEADEWYGELTEGSEWFSLGLDVEVAGERIPVMPLLVEGIRSLPQLSRAEVLDSVADEEIILAPLPDGRRLKLPMGRIKPMLKTLLELFDGDGLDGAGRLRLPRLHASLLPELAAGVPLKWQGGEALRAFGERLRSFKAVEAVPPPAGFRAKLRGYQQEGLSWLQFLRDYELAGILADDMGLGKTIQTLAHILTEKEAGRLDRPALVITPTSLVANWAHEAARFAPDLRVLPLHGADRKNHFQSLNHHDLVITTYPLLPRDEAVLTANRFHLVILDEAQNIKNARSKAALVVRDINARHKLCLTGTPMENHLGELWSIFHFLMPGLLGEEATFRRVFRNPIEKHGDELRRAGLAKRIAPFLLRRTKAQVVKELPPKTEITRAVALGGRQRDLYEAVRAAMDAKVRREIEKKGVERSQIIILDALLKLRQVCCDPRLLKLDTVKGVKESAKLDLLLEMLPELIEEGRRILLFSQFTSMLALIEEALAPLGIEYVKLTGQTRDRATPIRRFQEGEVPLFLISLKAGGVGLNLTAADTVIHYDPWWNPAVENQATDRAHRIGQERPVFVYKLIAEGTVEEKIAEMQVNKRELADALLSEGGKRGVRLSQEELSRLFEPLEA